MITLNETPKRTSKNFNINNISLDTVGAGLLARPHFSNMQVIGDLSVSDAQFDTSLTYGIGVKDEPNKGLKVLLKNGENIINFELDKENNSLIDNIEITANPNVESTLIINYISKDDSTSYHNGIIKLFAKKDSNVKIVITNFLNNNTTNLLSVENVLEENANVTYTVVDFGAKKSISNLYSNLVGDKAKHSINTIYLGGEDQLFDINYIAELRGKKTDINIEAQGALKDKAVKHFKGTIDFKKGAKKAVGNENESCMLLSNEAKSVALPMLLCSEEDVEGNHASSSGKIDDKELFYIMSRGFDRKEAMKLVVKAKFNSILETIDNEELKEKIMQKIDEKLM